MKRKLWVYMDEAQGKLSAASFDLLHKAAALIAPYDDYRLAALLLCGQKPANFADLQGLGLDEILLAEYAGFAAGGHLGRGAYLAALLETGQPDILLFPASDAATQVAATVGGKCGLGIMAHCVDLQLNADGLLTGLIPAFGGASLGEIYCPQAKPQIATGRLTAEPGAYRPAQPPEVVILRADEAQTALPEGFSLLSEEVLQAEGPALEDAQLIVCGGAGIGSAENWQLLQQVAERLGGAVACTRPPIDKGWAAGEHLMIGTSGKYVKPRVYLGIGVSGTSHHVCGMSDSGLILSVNNDKTAPIMALSDLAFVADSGEILQALQDILF